MSKRRVIFTPENPGILVEPISRLELPKSIYNHLEENGLLYICELIQLDRYEILRIMGVGRKTFQKLVEVLREEGLSLNSVIPGAPSKEQIDRYHQLGGNPKAFQPVSLVDEQKYSMSVDSRSEEQKEKDAEIEAYTVLFISVFKTLIADSNDRPEVLATKSSRYAHAALQQLKVDRDRLKK